MGGFFPTPLWRHVGAAALAVSMGACAESQMTTDTVAAPADLPTTEPSTIPVDDTPEGARLLHVTDRKDGDSWVASDGNEYRLGLVDAPERSQPCGREASEFTYGFLADGFRAEVYATDRYGRSVAEVFDPSGESLNIALAASGLGGDRYLEEFRHENPDLARRLDTALASALVPSCRAPATTVAPQTLAPPQPPPTTAAPTTAPPTTAAPIPISPTTAAPAPGCHPAYSPCVPVKGDGSGNGDANDLDCGDIGHRVQVVGTADPYRLDADGDGSGCESFG